MKHIWPRRLTSYSLPTAALLLSLSLAPPARAQLDLGTYGVRVYVLDVHHTGGPPARVGVVVVTGISSYTDDNNNVWAANSAYWFWDTGPAWPTTNSLGDAGFRLKIDPDQTDILDYDPEQADYAYDNDPFSTFYDDVGISGGSKRYKIWRVPISGTGVLMGYLKESEPSYDLTWYGYESEVNAGGYLFLTPTDVFLWFEPTTSTFNEDEIGVLTHEPR